MVDRHREEPVHLRGVQGHGDHPVGAGGDQHVRDQPAADREPGGVLLVRARVGVVGDHRGDLLRRGAAGGVEHQEQLHEVLLGRRHQRLDDVDVALAAVRLELRLQAVVAEPGQLDRAELDAERVADGGGEGAVGAAAEDDDLAQAALPGRAVGATRRPDCNRGPMSVRHGPSVAVSGCSARAIVGNGLNRQPPSPLDCCIITGASRPLPGHEAWPSPSQWPVSWLTTMCR